MKVYGGNQQLVAWMVGSLVSAEDVWVGFDERMGDPGGLLIHGEPFSIEGGRVLDAGDRILAADLELLHHAHVFVVVVVAMEDEGPAKRSKAHLDLGRGIGVEVRRIGFIGPYFAWALAVQFGDLV